MSNQGDNIESTKDEESALEVNEINSLAKPEKSTLEVTEINSLAKPEKSPLDVKEHQKKLDDDWIVARILVDAEHLQIDQLPQCWKKVLLNFFLIYRFITFSTAMMIAIGQFFTFKILKSSSTNVSLWIRYMSLFYIVLQCVMVALTEIGRIPFLTDSGLLRVWLTRGLIYFFIGVLCLQQNEIIFYDALADHQVRGITLKTFLDVVSYMMMSFGLFYSLMWALCLQRLARSIREQERQIREQAQAIKQQLHAMWEKVKNDIQKRQDESKANQEAEL